MENGKDKVKELLESGKELVGPTIGGGIGGLLGFLAAGPIGAAGGGALGGAIEKLISDVANRHLSKREEIRVGATTVFAISKIKERLEQGSPLRNDGFFEQKDKGRSSAEEVFEGVLLKAKNEHEEKKAKYIANLFVNAAFRKDFSIGQANHLLQIMQGFTYRQICLLALFGNKVVQLRQKDYSENAMVNYDTYSILLQIFDLYNKGLVACRDGADKNNILLLGVNNICPNLIFLTEIAKKYYTILSLEEVPREDIFNEVVVYLQT